MQNPNVFLAGSTGYLGSHLARALYNKGIPARLLVRDVNKAPLKNPGLGVLCAEVTQPETLTKSMHKIDVVISTIGITRQKDGLRYMDVDYQANMNLLDQSLNHDVKRFIYVSSLNGEKLRHLKICEAKEKFADALKSSGIDYTIVRPNGFFSDLGEFLKMAQKGRIFLPGDGTKRLNPIHGADLADAIIGLLYNPTTELNIGGPEIFTQKEIAQLCFAVAGKECKITTLPDWFRKQLLFWLRAFTSSKTYGPIEFFLTTLSIDMIAPTFGNHRLEDHLIKLRNKQKSYNRNNQ